MSCSNPWLVITLGLFFWCASRSMVGMMDLKRSWPSWGRSKNDILVMASPSIKLDGAPKNMYNFCPGSLEGSTGQALLFLILTTTGWWGSSNDNAWGEFYGFRKASLLPEVIGKEVDEDDRDDARTGRGSAPLTLFGARALADDFDWSFLFLSSTFVGLNLISTSNIYSKILKIKKSKNKIVRSYLEKNTDWFQHHTMSDHLSKWKTWVFWWWSRLSKPPHPRGEFLHENYVWCSDASMKS